MGIFHIENYTNMTQEELLAKIDLYDQGKLKCDRKDDHDEKEDLLAVINQHVNEVIGKEPTIKQVEKITPPRNLEERKALAAMITVMQMLRKKQMERAGL